jgi:hypothetical protein
VKEIPLTRGRVAKVDDADFAELSRYSWRAVPHHSNPDMFIAAATIRDANGNWVNVLMHRMILGLTSADLQGDHRNHDTLDNRRENLRIASPQQNSFNRRSVRSSTVPFKGVYAHSGRPKSKPFKAEIRCRRERYFLGYYVVAEDAARAYDQKAAELFGEFAYLNFPEQVSA